jgi:hypothetical protein
LSKNVASVIATVLWRGEDSRMNWYRYSFQAVRSA